MVKFMVIPAFVSDSMSVAASAQTQDMLPRAFVQALFQSG